MQAKPTYYWDACIFYEWLGKELLESAKKTAIDELLVENEAGKNLIVTSVITHLEVLPDKLEAKGASDEADYLALFDGEKFHEVEITTNILLRAREIRDHYYRPQSEESQFRMMDLGDCIHLATASIHKADEFHTRDNGKKRGKIPLIDLYEMYDETKLCGKYDLKIISPESDQPGFL